MVDYFPLKPFDYAAFIACIRELHRTGIAFGASPDTVHSLAFRSWRLATEDALDRIAKLKYKIKCGVRDRQFRAMWTGANAVQQTAAYVTDMSDTLTEFQLLLENFERHGDPHAGEVSPTEMVVIALRTENEALKATVAARAAEPLKLPEKGATLAWIRDNVPITTWAWAAGAISISFTAGVAVGAWPIVQTIGGKLLAHL